MSTKQRYIKVTYSDGGYCVCEPGELDAMTEGASGFKTDDVMMTTAEFEALPEFQG